MSDLDVQVVPPTITTDASSPDYIAGASATLDATLTISDPESAALSTAAVSIAEGFEAGDTLSADTAGTDITATYDGANGVLTLSGQDTTADYQKVLRSIVYSSTAPDPTNGGADPGRAVSWTVSDGVATSAAAMSTLNIVGPVGTSAALTALVPIDPEPDSTVTVVANTSASNFDAVFELAHLTGGETVLVGATPPGAADAGSAGAEETNLQVAIVNGSSVGFVGVPLPAGTISTDTIGGAAVTALTNGDFAVLYWGSNFSDGPAVGQGGNDDLPDYYVQMFNPSGATVGSLITVPSSTADANGFGGIVEDPANNGFVVSVQTDDEVNSIVQRFSNSGAPGVSFTLSGASYGLPFVDNSGDIIEEYTNSNSDAAYSFIPDGGSVASAPTILSSYEEFAPNPSGGFAGFYLNGTSLFGQTISTSGVFSAPVALATGPAIATLAASDYVWNAVTLSDGNYAVTFEPNSSPLYTSYPGANEVVVVGPSLTAADTSLYTLTTSSGGATEVGPWAVADANGGIVTYSETAGSGTSTEGVPVQATVSAVTYLDLQPPVISSATYNAATGALVMTGSNLTTNAADFSTSALTLTGQGGITDTLTGGTVSGNSATGFTVTLTAADQLAVDGLLNKNGASSAGNTTYNLVATASFDTGGSASSGGVTVSSALTPTISSVAYNAATGLVTLTGAGFENEGAAVGLTPASFTFKGQGGATVTLAGTASISSQTSATIQLSGPRATSVDAIFDQNGASSLDGTTYNLAATSGWDAAVGAAITARGVSISGYTPDVTNVSTSPSSGADLDATKTITFTLQSDEDLTVTGGPPELTLSSGVSGSAVYQSGSGTQNLVFAYQVASGDNTLDLKVTGLNLAGGTIKDQDGVALDAAGATDDTGIQLDTTPPTVSSINRAAGTPTNGASEVFTVTFSEGVTGVDSGDFTVATTGTTTDAGVTVTPVSASVYTVTVGGVGGSGALGLNLNSSGTAISDTAGNAIASGFTGQVYTIDTTPPTIASIALNQSAYGLGATVTATIALSGIYDGNGNYTLEAGSKIDGATLSAGTYNSGLNTLTATFIVGAGTTEVIAGNVATDVVVDDAVGNASAADTTPIANETIDTHAPTAISVAGFTDGATDTGKSPLAANAVIGALSTTDASVGDSFTYTLGGTDAGDFQIAGGELEVGSTALTDATVYNIAITSTDLGGNSFTQAVQVTGAATPTVASIDVAGPSALTASASDPFTVTFSQAVSGVVASNFSLSGTDATGTIGAPTSLDGGLTWTVPVTGVTGNGTLGLDLSTVSGITSVSTGTALGATHASDQFYTIDTTPPTLANVAASASYPVQGAAIVLSPGLTVSDATEVDLASATVTVAGGFTGDGDVLAANTTGLPSITAGYNSATEVLTLSGIDTLADYQAALRSVALVSTAADPTNGGANPSRTVTFQATGVTGAASAAQSETVGIVEVVPAGATTSNVTLYSGSTQSVTSGGTASGTTVVSGSNQVVGAGGVADGTHVSSGGGQYVNAGGGANGATVGSGGSEFVEIGGSASGTVLNGGAEAVYGTTTNATVNSGGHQYVEAGGTASGTIVSSGGVESITGAANGGTVMSGGGAYVQSGGMTGGTNVSGGDEYVEIGGTASGTTVNGGAEVVYGTANGATLNSGGYQYLEAGGTASGTIVNSTGIESINGVATGTTVNGGGADYVNSGGATTTTILSGGDEFVEVNATATGTIVDGGAQVVYGHANGTTLNSGGYQYVEAGATASGTIVNNTGIDIVLGTAIGTTDNAGGADYVYGGGTASGTKVTGGDEYVEVGGTTTGTTVSNGAQVVYGAATSTTLDGGGYQYVSSGGTAIGATINGGYDYVASGGTASATTISAGTLELASGGSATGTTTFIAGGGGTLRLDDSVHFGGLIAGFGQPEHLDLSDIAFDANTHVSFAEAGNNTSGTLTVTDGLHTANLTLLGQYATAQFTSGDDGHGGTQIGDPPIMAMTEPAPMTLIAQHQG
jgi:autotransporter passenger strand-loop-strand repeat protein